MICYVCVVQYFILTKVFLHSFIQHDLLKHKCSDTHHVRHWGRNVKSCFHKLFLIDIHWTNRESIGYSHFTDGERDI